jgi:VanZ family protein
MRQDQRTWLWWLAVGLWIGVVFGFSGDGFSADSTSRFIEPLVQWLFPELSAAQRELLHAAVRKAAHAFEYAVLAALAYRALRESPSRSRAVVFALGLVVAVAVADETHQRFEDSRTGSAVDVTIDVAGGAVALLLLSAIRRVVEMRRLQRESAR